MSAKVKKVIIPAAGWGTRMLPLTKVVHKELIPILNKPIIHYLVEEAAAAGLEEVILIISPRKKEILEYFNINKKLEDLLISKGEIHLLHKVQQTKNIIKIKVAIQKEQKGLAHAIYIGTKFINNEPFGIILADNLISAKIPALKQLITSYDLIQHSIIAIQKITNLEYKKYGIIKPIKKYQDLIQISGAIEKPQSKPPSDMAIIGRYVFVPEMKNILNSINWKINNEINFTDCIENLISQNKEVYAKKISGNMYDIGTIKGFVKATIDFSLQDKEIGKDILCFIKQKYK